MIVPACAAHNVSMHPDIPLCRMMDAYKNRSQLEKSICQLWQSALLRITSILSRAYGCIFDTVPQHDGTTVSLLNANARKPSCQSIAVAIKLVVCQLGLLVSGDDAMNFVSWIETGTTRHVSYANRSPCLATTDSKCSPTV